mmetsp:Transcript_22292/g.32580  ORF Transcript_22292/g.32580 Transcript_22292/m.32580 type:complete len:138 (-) Transcript_22292:112-525(-)|eukprot:CAMPEP_0197247008 /NCGR_PEP_ID=MMETSP1429-20130617/25429_1 /TAXON_ID=49237 /ORGANISM="Chaetoceros  sp., Strain UNC1202" /LENGTH=137 /DNA_ID=CAMNT_0042707811 /DNA_START=15 /DNA_END=428 /DNA_ORIENTATION=-
MVAQQKSVLGTYTDFVNTRKCGPNTPVRRSCRNRQSTPVATASQKKASRSALALTGNVEGKENSSTDPVMEDLCSVFERTLKVDNSSLKVKDVNTKVLSPVPKQGRYVTLQDDSGLSFTPVKRSTRSRTERTLLSSA